MYVLYVSTGTHGCNKYMHVLHRKRPKAFQTRTHPNSPSNSSPALFQPEAAKGREFVSRGKFRRVSHGVGPGGTGWFYGNSWNYRRTK